MVCRRASSDFAVADELRCQCNAILPPAGPLLGRFHRTAGGLTVATTEGGGVVSLFDVNVLFFYAFEAGVPSRTRL